MLTADLVRVRKRNGQLSVLGITEKARPQALELAQLLLMLTAEQEGNQQAQLAEAWDAVVVKPQQRKLCLGLRKLIEDACEFEEHATVDPRVLREKVFLQAAEARRTQGDAFDRWGVLSEVGEVFGLPAEVVDASLYSDLRSEHVLKRAPRMTPEQLIERYDQGQYQAVLLRAMHVTALVYCSDASTYRELFRALKFRRLIYTIHEHEKGYRIEIDGPFSLFDSVTKYGLQLALAFPTLCRCDSLHLSARLRWGKAREDLRFDFESHQPLREEGGVQHSDELDAFVRSFERLKNDWSIGLNHDLLHLPGVGLCVPDLVFRSGRETVYLEVMGFWSREAVWKRVELAEAGLPQKVIFAVSSRLRVSEAALPEASTAALYVYKGVLNARAVLQKLEHLRG